MRWLLFGVFFAMSSLQRGVDLQKPVRKRSNAVLSALDTAKVRIIDPEVTLWQSQHLVSILPRSDTPLLLRIPYQ